MVTHRTTCRLALSVLTVAVSAVILLAVASSALARVADTPVRPVSDTPAPIVRETVLQPPGGPGTVALLLIALGACAALVGAGYLGARIALRLRLAAARPGRPSRTNG